MDRSKIDGAILAVLAAFACANAAVAEGQILRAGETLILRLNNDREIISLPMEHCSGSLCADFGVGSRALFEKLGDNADLALIDPSTGKIYTLRPGGGGEVTTSDGVEPILWNTVDELGRTD